MSPHTIIDTTTWAYESPDTDISLTDSAEQAIRSLGWIPPYEADIVHRMVHYPKPIQLPAEKP